MEFKNIITNEGLLRALTENGILEPTEIQASAIPLGLEGRDIIAKSQTGTGKTLAFMLPVLEKIEATDDIQALVLCPTRELSIQVYNEILKYTKYLDGIKTVAVYGGQRIDAQLQKLKTKPQIVVATPGRLIDHLQRKKVKLHNVKTAILDEADEMISIGFKDELATILSYLPKQRQTLFFSATYPTKVSNLAKDYLTNPVKLEQKNKTETVDRIDQYYIKLKSSNKMEALKRLILQNEELSIVFCNTKRQVDEAVSSLQQSGVIAEGLHGDLTQQMRDNVMRKLRGGIINVLVATDVAARGIDVSNVGVVYNFDFPDDFEYYVHRIGRTGRAGKSGVSYTFVNQKQNGKIRQLMQAINCEIKETQVPDAKAVNDKRVERYLSNLKMESTVSENVLDQLVAQGHDYKEIALAIISEKFAVSEFSEMSKGQERGERGGRRERGERGRNGRGDRNERSDRGERGDRSRNKKKQGVKVKSDEVRLFINAGRKDGIKIKHILGALKNESGIRENDINDIEILPLFSFVTVPKNRANKALEIKELSNNKVNIEVSGK